MATIYSNTVIGDGPIAYWRLGEQSGTSAYDAMGNGYTGTYTGGFTLVQTGPIVRDNGTAVLLNGTTGYISTPAHFTDNWTSVTIEAWIKLTTLSLPTSPSWIANDNAGANKRGLVSYINSTATSVNFNLGNGTTNNTASGAFTFATGTWYHIACTWDGTTQTVYVNGVSKGTSSFTGPIGATINNLCIGHNPAGTDFFTGYIDEVAIYSYALSGTQVLNHYNTGIANTNSLYTIFNNVSKPGQGGSVVQAIDINQAVNVLQQPSGGQEKGHYILAGPGYVVGATVSSYVPSLSRNSTPVSTSLDAADIANSNLDRSPAGTDTLKSAGFHVFALTATGPQPNPQIGGNYTIQF